MFTSLEEEVLEKPIWRMNTGNVSGSVPVDAKDRASLMFNNGIVDAYGSENNINWGWKYYPSIPFGIMAYQTNRTRGVKR